MDDVGVRIIVVGVVVIAALVLGRLAARWQQPVHPPVDLSSIEVPAGIVAFTSTECDNCKRVMEMVRGVDVPVREVTHELESPVFAAIGVEAVPLLVVTDRDGNVVRQLAGVPRHGTIRRALAAAGW